MIEKIMADPDPGETGWSAPGPVWGETAPGLRGRETPQKGGENALPIKEGLGFPRQLDIRCWTTTIFPSEGHSWNGWTRKWRHLSVETGEEIDRRIDDEYVLLREAENFEVGIMWNALMHLQKCVACRELNGLALDEVDRALRAMREEWECTIKGR
jgi:hypothetical protein